MVVRHMDQTDLAERWNISARTLERWRWIGEGPRYVKLGGRVRYRLEDVEAYEAQQARASTAETGEGQRPPPSNGDPDCDSRAGRPHQRGAAA